MADGHKASPEAAQALLAELGDAQADIAVRARQTDCPEGCSLPDPNDIACSHGWEKASATLWGEV